MVEISNIESFVKRGGCFQLMEVTHAARGKVKEYCISQGILHKSRSIAKVKEYCISQGILHKSRNIA